jgi:hypothetical protein
LYDFNAVGGGVDMGLLVQPLLSENLWVGLTAQNLASSLSWSGSSTDTLGRAFGGGVAWRGWGERLLFAADVLSREGQNAVEFHAGAEVWVVSVAAVQLGWNSGHPSAGATYLWKPYELDYAFTFDEEKIGTTHQISLLLWF